MKIGNLFACGSMQILPPRPVEMLAFSIQQISGLENWLVFIMASLFFKIYICLCIFEW